MSELAFSAPSTVQRRPLTRAARIAWALVGLYVVLAAASIRFGFSVTALRIAGLWEIAMFGAIAAIGALIVTRHARHTIGWLFCAMAVGLGFVSFAKEYAIYALAVAPGTLPAGELFAWIGLWADVPPIAILTMFVPLLFPDGRLISERWRPVAWLGIILALVVTSAGMFFPSSYEPEHPEIRNPLGVEGLQPLYAIYDSTSNIVWIALVALSAGAVFLRLRGADDERRAQIKWFAYAMSFLMASVVLAVFAAGVPLLRPVSVVVDVIAISMVPAAVGIAILRYRLYDIDLIINKTVVYVLLTAVLAGIYTAAVAFFQRMFVAITGQGSDLAIVATLFVLATVFTPIKNTVQENVDRRIKPSRAPARHALDDLVTLADLHARGILTDEEFAAKKRQILGI